MIRLNQHLPEAQVDIVLPPLLLLLLWRYIQRRQRFWPRQHRGDEYDALLLQVHANTGQGAYESA